MTELDQRFGRDEWRLSRLADGAGLMRSAERERVELAMDRFQGRFPQLFFAVFTGGPGGRSDVRQFGFWLLNRAAFEDVALERPNECGILLTIDPDAKAAGLTWGYGLDPFLNESDTFTVLSRAHAYWVEGRFSEGVLRVIRELERLLVKRAGQARKDPEKFGQGSGGKGARRLREGHRQPEASGR